MPQEIHIRESVLSSGARYRAFEKEKDDHHLLEKFRQRRYDGYPFMKAQEDFTREKQISIRILGTLD
jgi:hypothetical protein